MKNKSGLGMLAWWLMVIGALNWGLVGLGLYAGSNWNVINLIVGSWPQVEWIVYILVGLSAIYTLFMCKKCCN
jgi:uncharacterized membrane protein YuzA (DUF378 family)